ncbi:hypothetical protein HYDPIDRAFT_25624 [Hydnomerulius pinastri MD-312]|nr:hypothetical protein HYDPIDRAFT_25624 [Hydnomerulius pinastri MD-312]
MLGKPSSTAPTTKESGGFDDGRTVFPTPSNFLGPSCPHPHSSTQAKFTLNPHITPPTKSDLSRALSLSLLLSSLSGIQLRLPRGFSAPLFVGLNYTSRNGLKGTYPRSTRSSRTLDALPTTDASAIHVSDVNTSDFNTTDRSDVASDSEYNDSASDVDLVAGNGDAPSTAPRVALSDIAESESPSLAPSRASSPSSWSVTGGSDFEVPLGTDPESESERGGRERDEDIDKGFAASVESLTLSTHLEEAMGDTTLTHSRLRYSATVTTAETNGPSLRDQTRECIRSFYPHSTSSLSPAGRSPRRSPKCKGMKGKGQNAEKLSVLTGAIGNGRSLFYEQLFG